MHGGANHKPIKNAYLSARVAVTDLTCYKKRLLMVDNLGAGQTISMHTKSIFDLFLVSTANLKQVITGKT